jgi:hypothetical protein
MNPMNLLGDNGQLFGWSEATWRLLDQAGILIGYAMLLLPIAAWIGRNRIRDWLRRNRFPRVGGESGADTRWDALVFTVSRFEVPAWVLERHPPAAVALLATEQSKGAARRLAELARRRGIGVADPRLLQDPDDPAGARDETAGLIQHLREQGHERIGVDVTGGKTPMSLGAFMAAEENGCDSLYVTTRYDARLKRPDMSSARIVTISRRA